MKENKGKLFELAEEFKKYRPQAKKEKKTIQVKGTRFDEGLSINLSYSLDLYPQSIYDGYRNGNPAVQLSFEDGLQSEAFYVESFDQEKEDTRYAEVLGTEEEEEILERVVSTQPSKEPQNGEKKNENPGNNTDPMMKEDVENTSKDIQKDEGTEAHGKESPENEHNPSSFEVSNEELANDIKAILQGEKIFDPTQKKTISRKEISPTEILRQKDTEGTSQLNKFPEKIESTYDPEKNEHQIFEKIAQSMRYANSYDLGSIAMETRFDLLEKDIEEEEIKNIHDKKRENTTQDAEIVEEELPTSDKGMFNPETALDTSNGGQSIKEDKLQPADLILFTPTQNQPDISNKLCYGGVYDGNGKIIYATNDHIPMERDLSEILGESEVVAALRAKSITEENGKNVVEKVLETMNQEKDKGDLVHLYYPHVGIHPSVCEKLPSDQSNKCQLYNGKIYLGNDNETFSCARMILNAFGNFDLHFLALVKNEKDSTLIDPLEKPNNPLQYLGHLKQN
ncbi:hypothetical protein P872_12165 [Rhodonellum psychrophilum GCM71 = DSM 17998]|uniref:Uncharacterized protein n=2 Tax=Rhodonellum TaxID=336827 RepID=U5BY45_9BACT|nr:MULTISPECIES: hypothetical protein [Rhodonellum]ERM80822.1 hypothetical protein P872_12165 [Rhodonellum psychrophilum GCM71 = DSM 17998]SDZ24034.1 hypothetical protein SAMN05444412_10871 [Rhodonellum ikkaensis]